MYKMSIVGCLQSLLEVFHGVVSGFLWYCKPNQLKSIFKLGNCFWLLLQLVIRLQHCPKPDNPLD